MCHDTVDQSLIEPSLHYQTDLSTGGDEPAADDVANGVWSILGGDFLALCHDQYHVDSVVARSQELKGSGVIPVLGQLTVNQPGQLTSGGFDLPRELVGIVNLYTDAATRSGRGYTSLPCPGVESFLQDRLWFGSYKTACDSFASKCDNSFSLGTISVATVNPVVYSATRRARGQAPYTFRVQSARFNTRPHWLRSRGTSP